MGVMNNGMSIMGVGVDWQQVIKGAVLDARRVPRCLLQEKGPVDRIRHREFEEAVLCDGRSRAAPIVVLAVASLKTATDIAKTIATSR